ncbi:unnamed protein product [Sympodiomycopsis kandeliae]
MPSVDFDQSVGFALPTQPVSWNRRDVLLYNVGLNVPPAELEYLYEKTDNFRPIPTYPLVLGFKGTSDEVTDFNEYAAGREIPGFPTLDPNTLVHAEQSLDIHRPLPILSGPGWKLRKRVSGVHDKKTGLILEQEVKLIDPVGRLVATMVGSSFYRGQSQGTNYSKTLITNRPATLTPPSRDPDYKMHVITSPAQAALYRLSGDYNPLHIDPSIGQNGGLGGVILHGLCSYGLAARAILKSVDDKDGQEVDQGGTKASYGIKPRAELKSISARFTSPVKPSSELITQIWFVEKTKLEGIGQEIVIAFDQVIAQTGKKSLGGGRAVVLLREYEVTSRL